MCYKPQPATYNQFQQYCKERITQQDRSKNDYDRDKVVKLGNIHSGINTPNKTKVPIIQLGNNYYTIEKNPNDSSLTSIRTETRCTNKKVTSIFSI